MRPREQQILGSAFTNGIRGPNNNGEYSVNCPWCPSDTKFKLQLNPVKGAYFCYRCEARGYLEFDWLDQVEAPKVDPSAPVEWDHEPDGFVPFGSTSLTSFVLRPYVTYLRDQRHVWRQAISVGAGACMSGKYAGRVVVPMKDDRGNWLGFSSRVIVPQSNWPDAPKYLYPKGMDRKTNLWGLSWVPRLKDKTRPLWLTEGVFDALPLYPYGVASFGKNVTNEQLDRLAEVCGVHLVGETKVVVGLDGDAWEEGRVICQRLRLRGVDCKYARLPPCTDPGVLGLKVNEFITE